MAYQHLSTAYVTEDGSWSSGTELVVFDVAGLTAEQWDILDSLPDSKKLPFTLACLNSKDIQHYIDEYYF